MLNDNFDTLDTMDLMEVDGGVAPVVVGIAFVAVCGGAFALGVYNGYQSTK